jgi:PPOX class probable F420-dependent enzyme
MQKRDAIRLSDNEQEVYLREAPTIILVTLGRDGYPHAVPMWFLVDEGGVVSMTTYGRSQKVVNVRRNPKVALLVESGVRYEELKGVLLRGRAEVIDDHAETLRVLMGIHTKHAGGLQSGIEDVMRAQANKRVVVRVTPERVTSWDHRKLGGAY